MFVSDRPSSCGGDRVWLDFPYVQKVLATVAASGRLSNGEEPAASDDARQHWVDYCKETPTKCVEYLKEKVVVGHLCVELYAAATMVNPPDYMSRWKPDTTAAIRTRLQPMLDNNFVPQTLAERMVEICL